jgi:hypothetical protein
MHWLSQFFYMEEKLGPVEKRIKKDSHQSIWKDKSLDFYTNTVPKRLEPQFKIIKNLRSKN